MTVRVRCIGDLPFAPPVAMERLRSGTRGYVELHPAGIDGEEAE